MSYESISMEQLLNISKFFSNTTVQRLIYGKENIESLSLEELKKICFELSSNVKNRSPFLFSSPYVKYFKEYPQALEIINEFMSVFKSYIDDVLDEVTKAFNCCLNNNDEKDNKTNKSKSLKKK